MNMFSQNPRIGQELLDVPMGQMIESMAMSIAKAQMALDSNSIEVAEMMGGLSPVKSEIGGKEFINFKDSRVFFGKEKVKVSNAIDLYNSNTDQAYRASIKDKLQTTEYEDGYSKDVVNVDKDITTATDAIFTPDNQKNAEVYYRKGTNWYSYNSISDKYETITNTPTKVAGKIMLKPGTPERFVFLPQRLSMLELGFSPTFYQFVDTIIKVSISIKFTREGSSSVDIKSDSKAQAIVLVLVGETA
ncbi:MAG: hypothetical protein HC854_03830 [Flavobacterium sp.]|nr:hypothetical protein [Flavobacterium sp.]